VAKNYKDIKSELLKKHEEVKVINYINYLTKIETDKDKAGKSKNAWFHYKKETELIDMFNKMADNGLFIDGDLVTIQSTGISLSYNAYKNLVLLRYPETKFDIQLVRDGDDFDFHKKDGKVFYQHKLNSPFLDKDIVGAYCIIKNRLGEFIETISLKELEHIRLKAKTDYIWKEWTPEMYLKTITKRAFKRHFKDIITKVEEIDNENYDMDNPIDIDLKIKQDIESMTTSEDLKKYYTDNKETVVLKKSFHKLVSKRNEELKNENI